MWSSPDKPVPTEHINKVSLEVLKTAIDDCVEFNVAERQEVHDALKWFSNRGPRDQGVRLFKAGLSEPDPIKRRNSLRHAFEKILMQTGFR